MMVVNELNERIIPARAGFTNSLYGYNLPS